MKKLPQVLRNAQGKLSPKDYETLRAIADTYTYFLELASDETMTTARLRELLGYPKSDSAETDIDDDTDPEMPDQGTDRSGAEG